MKSNLMHAHVNASKKALLTVAVTAAVLASGCASISAPEKSSSMAAFEQLSLQPDGTRSWRSAAAANAAAVHIDPKAIVFAADVGIDDEQRQILRWALVEALTKQFNEAGLNVIETPVAPAGAAAINVRATITGVELASPAVNIASAIFLFMPVSRGSMSVEIEATAIGDGKRVAAMAFSGTAGINNIGSAFTSIGHAKLQADLAATKFIALVTGASKTN